MELGFTYTSLWHELQQAKAEHESCRAKRARVDDRWSLRLQRKVETWNAWAEYTALGQPEAPTPPAPEWEPAHPLP